MRLMRCLLVLVLVVLMLSLSACGDPPPPNNNNNNNDNGSSDTSPLITIALDYYGIRNTLWMSQIGGGDYAKVQLVVSVHEGQKNLKTVAIPPEGIEGFDMDFFQVRALKDNMDPRIFSGTVAGDLTFYVAAYNVDKGAITKAQIDLISKWTGVDWSRLKELIPDRELIGYYWRTWSPSELQGIGDNYDNCDDAHADLTVWLRIGSDQIMPDPVAKPVLKPDVEIVGNLPTNARARTYSDYRASDFAFTLTNNETFEVPIYWHLETNSNPGTVINWVIYPTEGKLSIPGKDSRTITYPYWFTTPGDYQWKYVAEYPKGNPVASWEGTLTVAP